MYFYGVTNKIRYSFHRDDFIFQLSLSTFKKFQLNPATVERAIAGITQDYGHSNEDYAANAQRPNFIVDIICSFI